MKPNKSLSLRRETIRVLSDQRMIRIDGGDCGCLIVISLIVSTATIVLCAGATDGPATICQPRPQPPYQPPEPKPIEEIMNELSQIGFIGSCAGC